MLLEDLKLMKLPDVLIFNNKEKIKDKKDWLRRREEIKEILSREEYGHFPKDHAKITSKIIEENNYYCKGTTIFRKVLITMHLQKEFSFHIKLAIPKRKEKCPAFIYLDFHEEFPNKNIPVQEICNNGFAIISVCYTDITTDDNNFNNGLSEFFKQNQEDRDFGKILVWSWAAMHVMDYVQTIKEIDNENIAIIGLSRLGKTALLTGAFDERFKYTISNDSGQSGAALSRNKRGERIKDICNRFPYWFSTNYLKYVNNEDKQPFDQHFLTSLVSPRYLYISSASEDVWADPKAEFLCCVETNRVYQFLKENGINYTKKTYPLPNQEFHEGKIGYHIREGKHDLVLYDWNKFMKYINFHK